MFSFLKNSYKRFNWLTKKKKILHHINLIGPLQNPLFLWNNEEKLIHQCFRVGNKQALFWVEAHKYFVQCQTKAGKEICERPQKYLSKKEIFECFFKTPLFLGKWCGVTTYFLYQKKKKNLNTNLHDWIFSFLLIE